MVWISTVQLSLVLEEILCLVCNLPISHAVPEFSHHESREQDSTVPLPLVNLYILISEMMVGTEHSVSDGKSASGVSIMTL